MRAATRITATCAVVLMGLAACAPNEPGTATPNTSASTSTSTSTVTTVTPTATTTSAVAGASGPSFDCATAATDVEKMVCSDPALASLDRRLAAEYAHALKTAGADRAALQSTQDGWVAGRDECGKAGRNAGRTAEDMHRCLVEAYQTRLVELKIDDPDTVRPPTITYSCPGQQTLTARFYNQFDPPAAVLTHGTDSDTDTDTDTETETETAIVFIERSGSGARYGRTGVEYWEHQGEVTVDFYGDTFVCRTP